MQNALAGPGDALGKLTDTFRNRISELHIATGLRISDSAKDLVLNDVERFEAKLLSLEHDVEDLRNALSTELQSVPKVQAVLDASNEQQRQVEYIAAHLPQYLPGPQQEVECAGAEDSLPGDGEATDNASNVRASRVQRAESDTQHKTAPRRYVTQGEFNKLSDYMTNRLTLDKVNAGLDDAACLGEANLKLLAAARANAKLTAAQRSRSQMLLVNVAGKELVKGRHWFGEEDRRQAAVLKTDKTGKQLLTILRHLKRIDENRINIKGAMQTIYVIMA